MAFQTRMQRSLLFAFIGSICSCALVGILILITGITGRLLERSMITLAIIGGASLLALGGAIPTEKRRWQPIGPAALAVISASLVLSIVATWVDFQFWSSPLDESIFTAWLWSLSLTLVGLLAGARLRSQWQWISLTTVGIAVLATVQITATIWTDISDEDTWFRILSVLLIIAGCGVIVTPVLHHISRIKTREQVKTADLMLSLTCPRCRKTQELAVGHSACAGCGLKFAIDIEEETCTKCGYPLYQIQSAACPECGEPILQPAVSERPAPG